MVDGKITPPVLVLAKLDFTQETFFLIGFIPAFMALLFFLLAVFYRGIWVYKYICIAFFALTVFFASLGYTRLGFANFTHAIYHSQSYKINAINIGIITVLAICIVLLLLTVILLVLRRIFPKIDLMHEKHFYLSFFLIISTLAQWVVIVSPLLHASS